MNRNTPEMPVSTGVRPDRSPEFLVNSGTKTTTDTPELVALGQRLRSERLKRNEAQATFAARLGISVPTLRKMEAGDSTVQIGHWAAALGVLDRDSDIDLILAPQEDLFAKYDKKMTPPRQRARSHR